MTEKIDECASFDFTTLGVMNFDHVVEKMTREAKQMLVIYMKSVQRGGILDPPCEVVRSPLNYIKQLIAFEHHRVPCVEIGVVRKRLIDENPTLENCLYEVGPALLFNPYTKKETNVEVDHKK